MTRTHTEILPRDTALMMKITHTKPIEVSDLVATMNGIGTLFDCFCRASGDSSEARKARLYVEKIEHGSIEIFLVETISALALPLLENLNIIMDFAAHLKAAIDFFTGKSNSRPNISREELRPLHDLFAVTAGDNRGTMDIGAVAKGDINVTYNNCVFNYSDSNTAQNQIKREERELKERDTAEVTLSRQLMTIFQMRGDMGTNTGNKAIIEAISPRALPLVFETDDLKLSILAIDDNPTKQAYLVDVVIQQAGGRPAAYKVMALHDIVPLEE